jgi:hypothetical protein
MDNLTKVLVAALENALQALYNVPEVGKKYDQQHSDTQMAATLVINDALKLATESASAGPLETLEAEPVAAAPLEMPEPAGPVPAGKPLSDGDVFNYQLLGRLQMDCEYYLGFGNRSKKHLWALDEAAQIQKMKELYAELPEKPEWLTFAEIEKYEAEMVRSEDAASVQANQPKTPGKDT